MLCEHLIETRNDELSLSVTVRATNLGAPRSEEELKHELLAHALDCHECLTVVLFHEDSLAECGCATYKEMFRYATEELERQTPIDPSVHLTEEATEAFFLDRLSDEQLQAMADHVELCGECRDRLQMRQSFHLAVKAAVQEQKSGHRTGEGLSGILGVAIPEAGIHFCSRINV